MEESKARNRGGEGRKGRSVLREIKSEKRRGKLKNKGDLGEENNEIGRNLRIVWEIVYYK